MSAKLLSKTDQRPAGLGPIPPHHGFAGESMHRGPFHRPPPEHPFIVGFGDPKFRKKQSAKEYQEKGGFTSANTRHLAMIASHPSFYLVDPSTPPFLVDRHTFDQFMRLLHEALYPYNQHQHGGLKICTFCFGFVTRKVGFHSDPPAPDQVLPEYTLAEAVGKLDDTNEKRYKTFVELLTFMKKTGYRPLCRPDPQKRNHRGMGYSHEAPEGYIPVYDLAWEPHFPKFHCTYSHKCYQFYLGNGPGAALARRVRKIASLEGQDDWLKRMEVLPSQLRRNFKEWFQLEPEAARNLEEIDPHFPTHLQKPVDPEFSSCFPGQFNMSSVESDLLKNTFELLGMTKLTLVLPHSPVPVRLDLSQCRFFSDPVTVSSQKVREWAFLVCTGRRWHQAREEEPQPIVSMAKPHEEHHFIHYQEDTVGPIIQKFQAEEDLQFEEMFKNLKMQEIDPTPPVIQSSKTESLDREFVIPLKKTNKKKQSAKIKPKKGTIPGDTVSTNLETTEGPSTSVELLGKRTKKQLEAKN